MVCRSMAWNIPVHGASSGLDLYSVITANIKLALVQKIKG